MVLLDYGYRSKCCLAAIKMGKKKIKKTNQVIKVWVCVACGTKDVSLISRSEANDIRKQRNSLVPEIDDDRSFSE